MARRIGETQDQYLSRREQQGDQVYIKYFRKGDTKVRIMQPVSTFTRYRYHYESATRESYPCVAPNEPCVGHRSPHEWERSAATGYVFNGLDKDGNLHLYRSNVKLRDLLNMKEQRNGDITGYDVIVVKSGEGKDGTYWDVEIGKSYPIPFEGELHDIEAILGEQYDQALAARMSYMTEDGAPAAETPWKEEEPAKADDSEIIVPKSAAAAKPAKAAKPKAEPKTEPKAEVEPEAEPAAPEEPARLSDAEVAVLLQDLTMTVDGQILGIEEMEASHLREWLAQHNGPSLPLNAGRGVLMHAVKDRLALGEAPF